jgi:hypothetical protein
VRTCIETGGITGSPDSPHRRRGDLPLELQPAEERLEPPVTGYRRRRIMAPQLVVEEAPDLVARGNLPAGELQGEGYCETIRLDRLGGFVLRPESLNPRVDERMGG